jgi:hypothetical protein
MTVLVYRTVSFDVKGFLSCLTVYINGLSINLHRKPTRFVLDRKLLFAVRLVPFSMIMIFLSVYSVLHILKSPFMEGHGLGCKLKASHPIGRAKFSVCHDGLMIYASLWFEKD